MNKKENSGYQRTHAALREAVLALAAKKGIDAVTVREICEKAGVNRSTFYAHFQDVYAVLEEVGAELEAELVAECQEVLEPVIGDWHDAMYSTKTLVVVLEHLRAHRIFYKLYFSANNKDALSRSMELLRREIMEPFYRSLGLSDRESAYYFDFYKSGLVAIVRQWIRDGCPETPEELTRLVSTMMPLSPWKQ